MASLHEADSEYVQEDTMTDGSASRNIRVSVNDTNATSTFKVVEETNWNEATWREIEGPPYTLIVDGSDVSGTLRFKGPVPAGEKYPEFFLVALGIDTDSWCDLKVDLAPKETGAFFQPKYFEGGTPEFEVKQNHQKTVTKKFTISEIIVTVTITKNLLVVSWE
jgi:hypothetical protein